MTALRNVEMPLVYAASYDRAISAATRRERALEALKRVGLSDRANHKVVLIGDPGTDRLSESELKMIAEIYSEHGQKSAFDLVAWCHRNCPEWRPVTQGRHEIRVEDILEAAGKGVEQIKRIASEALNLQQLNQSLG